MPNETDDVHAHPSGAGPIFTRVFTIGTVKCRRTGRSTSSAVIERDMSRSERTSNDGKTDVLGDSARKPDARPDRSVGERTSFGFVRPITSQVRPRALADYGKRVIEGLACRLRDESGKGYDRSNLFHMRAFLLAYPKIDALRRQ